MEIIEPPSSVREDSGSLAQARAETWGPQASHPSSRREGVISVGLDGDPTHKRKGERDDQSDGQAQKSPGAGDVGPPSAMPPSLEPNSKWSPLPADASPEIIQKNLEREAGELAAQISKDHFADATQQKVAQFIERFPEGAATGIDMINAKLAKDGLYLNFEDDPDKLSKKYTGKMLKEGTFQNDIIGAVTLIDQKTNTAFPDPLILLGHQKKHYDI